jgi:DNA-damage-inducible protein J
MSFCGPHPFEEKIDNALQMPHIHFMKTAAVHSRIEPEIKEMAEVILRKLGLSPTDAIRLFYTQITLRNGLPFPVSMPNQETVQALEDSKKNRDLSTYSTTDQLFESWDK